MAPTERVAAWLRFAREDLLMARLAQEAGVCNQACFHSQQAAEKLLKAFLEARGGRAPRVHALAELVSLCTGVDPGFREIVDSCVALDRFYIPTRYPEAVVGSLPDRGPNEADAREALVTADEVLRHVSARLSEA